MRGEVKVGILGMSGRRDMRVMGSGEHEHRTKCTHRKV